MVWGRPTERFDDYEPGIQFDGSWSTAYGSSYSGYSAKIGRGAGVSVTVPFNGTMIDWIAYEGPYSGIAHVYLDSVDMGTVDLYAPATEYRQQVWSARDLAFGPHTLRIEWTGTKNPASGSTYIDVDAFDIDSVTLP